MNDNEKIPSAPWSIDGADCVNDANGRFIAHIRDFPFVEHIVRCVNHYAAQTSTPEPTEVAVDPSFTPHKAEHAAARLEWFETPEGQEWRREHDLYLKEIGASSAAIERDIQFPPLPDDGKVVKRGNRYGSRDMHAFAREHEKNVRAALAQATPQAPEGE